jgi:hypothetical protein
MKRTQNCANPSKELKMKANVYDKGQALAVVQPNELGRPTHQKTKAPARTVSAQWLVPAALLVLSFVPISAGAFRLTQLAGGAGPAGTAWPGGSWFSAGCWLGFQGCG